MAELADAEKRRVTGLTRIGGDVWRAAAGKAN